MGRQTIRLTQNDFPVFGKVFSLADISFLVINENLELEYINKTAMKKLKIDFNPKNKKKSFFHLWESAHLSPILNKKGELIPKQIMHVGHYILQWQKIKILIENKPYILLIDKDVSVIEHLFKEIEATIESEIGYTPQNKVGVKDYIQEITNYYTSVINKIPCYVYWKSTQSKYLGCNEMAAQFFGFNTPSDIIGKNDFDLFQDPNLAKSFQDQDIHVFKTSKPIMNSQSDLQSHDGSITNTLVSKVPITDLSGNIIGLVGITVDVTELTKAKEAAEAAHVAKTTFIANMSHDIRTPLTGVIGLSEILENTLENLEQKEEAHMLHDSGEKLLSMLNDILDDVRAEHMNESDIHEEIFDLYQCIQDLIKLELPTTKLKHLNLQVHIDANVPQYIISDRKKIHRILLNLLGNAIKFTKSGHITIEVNCLDVTKSSAHLQFGVADTGIGISQEFQAHVFERFSRATPSYKGLYEGHGLGLHIAHSYVSLLGGHITVTSKEGMGTTFHFDLKCKIGQQIKIKAKKTYVSLKKTMTIPKTKPPALLNESITSLKDTIVPHLLLVEDSVVALKVLENIVSKAGYQFTSIDNGEEAFELAKSMTFNLVITDIGLPGISGNELSRLIRDWEKKHNQKPLPIFGLTGHAKDSAKPECVASGMNDVFSKPLNLDILQKMIGQFVLPTNLEDPMPKPKENINQSSKLGLDLPNTEEELFLLEAYPMFDTQYALQQINDLSLLFQIVKDFISEKGQEDIQNIKVAYAQKDWSQVEKLAHKLKGGAVYIGIKRFQYACQYLERYYKAEHRDLLDKLYHQLLKVHCETIETLEAWLQKYTNI